MVREEVVEKGFIRVLHELEVVELLNLRLLARELKHASKGTRLTRGLNEKGRGR